MKTLHFMYEMQIEYTIPVETCNYTIKCIPKDTKRQKIKINKVELYPNTHYNEGVDGLLNKQIYGVNEASHNIFLYRIEGEAITGLEDYEEEENPDLDMIFKHPHGLNLSGDNIKQFFIKNNPEGIDNPVKKAVYLMNCLNRYMTYERYNTDVNKSAEEAFSLGKGVCQDYAHIFISLMHLAKIPSRYVTGLIMGEGESHAWVEILYDNKWIGIDPTNNTMVNDDYIKIGVGRDAKDCMINRGIMHGGGYHTQSISVLVNEE